MERSSAILAESKRDYIMMTLEEALQTVADDPKCCVTAILVRERNDTTETALGLKIGNGLWATPGGGCEVGETLEQSARREVLEETGINDVIFTKYCGGVPGTTPGVILHVFFATTEQEPQLTEPDVFREWKWFPLSEVPEDFQNEDLRSIAQTGLV